MRPITLILSCHALLALVVCASNAAATTDVLSPLSVLPGNVSLPADDADDQCEPRSVETDAARCAYVQTLEDCLSNSRISYLELPYVAPHAALA